MIDIRRASPADAATILGFIRDLAVYEREPDAVETTEQSLRAHLAAEHPPFEALLARSDVDGRRRDVGMALYFPTFSTWTGTPGVHLEDLFVDPAARGTGTGRALLAALARLVVERGWSRLEWAVLDWNRPAIDFYDHVGARPLDDWITYRLSGDELTALAASSRGAEPTDS